MKRFGSYNFFSAKSFCLKLVPKPQKILHDNSLEIFNKMQ
ncbi:SLEI domain protein, PF07620 family [Leptospira interrogans serovar Zanoni str. LT2156]|uniref:SLEI domain protein, PF07620 family n=1 Tax=Leptospira interrogans serovar Zanoni str. LT2156 TaxID=1001601 RepID=M6HFJ9_LEPIR|nr:SLEI domain protein, PF07620 family [Leptospira interrogans serovar Zanoni str. LT2156]